MCATTTAAVSILPLGAVKLVQGVATGALLAEPAHHTPQEHCGCRLVAGADLAAPEVRLELCQVYVAAVNLQGGHVHKTRYCV